MKKISVDFLHEVLDGILTDFAIFQPSLWKANCRRLEDLLPWLTARAFVQHVGLGKLQASQHEEEADRLFKKDLASLAQLEKCSND